MTTVEPTMIQGKPAYTLKDAQNIPGVSYTSLQNILRRNKIEKFE
ncbi:hypothetical protein [Ktedonobacter robiniae]|nr:hypothetical protein [Ktedonobacter robiniae]